MTSKPYRWTEYEKHEVLSVIDAFGTIGAWFKLGSMVSRQWRDRMLDLGVIELAEDLTSNNGEGATECYRFTAKGREWAYENKLVSADGKREDDRRAKMEAEKQAQKTEEATDYWPECDSNEYVFERTDEPLSVDFADARRNFKAAYEAHKSDAWVSGPLRSALIGMRSGFKAADYRDMWELAQSRLNWRKTGDLSGAKFISMIADDAAAIFAEMERREAVEFADISYIMDRLSVGQCRAFVNQGGRWEDLRWAFDMGLMEWRMNGTLELATYTVKGQKFLAQIK